LLELSRQRLRPALSETTHINCPRCSGMGTIRSVESMSLALLRLIGEEARKERTGRVITQVPVDVATYLINEKREQLQQIETRDKVSLVIVPNPHMQTPAYTLRRVRDDEKELPENTTVSYQLADQPSVEDSNIGNRDKKPPGDVPLVPSLLSAAAAPVIPMPVPAAAPAAVQTAHVGVLVRLWRWLFGNSAGRAVAASPAPTHTQRDRPPHRDARHDRYRSGGDRDRNRDRNRDARRDAPRDAQRDGQRDPRRDARPRGDFGARREGSGQPDRNSSGQRNEAQGPRQDQSFRPDQSPRGDMTPRADQAPRPDQTPRADQPPRAEQPRGNDPERSAGERGERGGRSRRRRGRGRREGGENTANGAGASPAFSAGPGATSSPAPNEVRAGDNSSPPSSAAPSFEPAPPFESVRSSEPARSFEPTRAEPAPAYEPPRERPVANAPAEPAPFREPPPAPSRADEPAASSKANENKYVVWSSTPSDIQRSGPDER
jgi:ribonuclease E